ncbi:restriction endonuclease subunit S [Staphylococcus pasteuri]|uniref:restriction endonuclease subunit S n=1 Tax=Staphylococcus pasteuri TaxID=45972 RepID=UPI002DBDC1E0|nr:restriction endonuclease subunit S [Staphylococcus pasteuri]MEB6210248.1 restriction endonuclease subunit S [Staphylococcus pasteuri]
MSNIQKNVPELRFPGFEDEWKNFAFKDQIISIEKGTNLLGAEDNTGIPLIKMGNIKRGYFSFNKLEKLNEAETIQEKYFINKGDFLFNTRNTMELVGKSATWTDESGKFVFNSNIARIVLKGIDTYFFNYLYNTSKMINKVKSLAVGTTSVAAIYPRDLNHLNYFLPSISEQEKIGSFFSKLDRQIELEEEKLELLEQQKKGYMQKIFSQELRFKDDNGNDYPNWENENLGNLINEVNVRTTSNNQYVLLSSTKNGLLSQEEYFKKQIGSKDSTGYKILRLNQLVLSPQNLWLGNININQRFDIGIVSPSYRIYNLSHQFDINFAKDLLKSPRYIYEYAQASEQGASVVRRNLNLELFYSIKVSLPSIEEQRKIGAFLNKLDKLMRKQYNKIEVLKQRKQGLLQKMFV